MRLGTFFSSFAAEGLLMESVYDFGEFGGDVVFGDCDGAEPVYCFGDGGVELGAVFFCL